MTVDRRHRGYLAGLAIGVFAELALGAGPGKSHGGNPLQTAGYVVAGPMVLLLWLASMAVVYLIAASFRKQDGILTLAESAVVEAGSGKVVNTLWGLIAEILIVSAGLMMAKVPQAALLTVLLFVAAMALAGFGAMVSARVAGRRLHAELAGGEVSDLGALSIGLRLLFLATALPVVGWIVVILVTANGVGSILTASSSSNRSVDPGVGSL